MTTNQWHLDADTIESYRDDALSPAMAASLEAHVVACAACRSLMAEYVEPQRAARSWSAIVERVDVPTLSVAERLLIRLGLRDHIARLIALTPTFRLAWLGAVVVVSSLAVIASTDRTLVRGDRGSFAFLILAPILPVLGVAVAFNRRTDPAYELTAATPYSAFELLFLRASAVLVTSTIVNVIASFGLPGSAAAEWLLPALGLTTLTVALARWFPVSVAAGALTAMWLGAATITARSDAASQLIREYPPFRPAGQAAFLALACVALSVAFATRRSFDFRRAA